MLVKLKSSIASKFSKARLKFIIVIVQSETETVESAAGINGETFSK